MFDSTQFLLFLAASAVLGVGVGNAVHVAGVAAHRKVAAETADCTWHA